MKKQSQTTSVRWETWWAVVYFTGRSFSAVAIWRLNKCTNSEHCKKSISHEHKREHKREHPTNQQWALQNNRENTRTLERTQLIENKQEHKVSYRCSLPSPLQKGSKDYKILHRSSARFFDFGKKFLRNLRNFLPKSKKTLKLKTSMQSFVILGSLRQWRWQWASIGHFVFLFWT